MDGTALGPGFGKPALPRDWICGVDEAELPPNVKGTLGWFELAPNAGELLVVLGPLPPNANGFWFCWAEKLKAL